MRKETARADRIVAQIAARQHGVVSFQQLIAAGLDPAAIWRRAQAARLHRIHRGVYAVGHRKLSHQGWWMAAVLACGQGAVLSHRSAAMHWGMRKPVTGTVEVTVPTGAGRSRRKGIRVHRSTSLTAKAVAVRQGIPTTTPERTILDLKQTLDRKAVLDLIGQAEVLHLPIGRFPDLDHEPTRSRLERRFLKLCRQHGIPQPEVNVKIGPWEVDFLWRDARLVIETDGWETHRTHAAFELDRLRDAELKAGGYEVVRFTYWRVFDHGEEVAALVRKLLSRRTASWSGFGGLLSR